jgi:hypothetical protein
MPGTDRNVIVQDRDRCLFRELGDTVRILDREQASVIAGWTSVTRANARLLLLHRAGWLERFFVGTISGGRKAIYTLSRQGAALVEAPYRGIRRRPGRWFSSDLFAEHQLRINSIFITVKYRSLPSPDARFLGWRPFYDPISSAIQLMPDGYFELELADGVRASFLEVDLGNEPQRIWRVKVQRYLQLAISGEFSRIFGQQQFRVLVIAHSDRRLDRIRATAAKLTNKIFWFATFNNIQRDGLWAPIWIRATGDQRHSLS